MTCIAFDGRTLAADKRTSYGGLHRTTTKIFRVDDMLVGCAGNSAVGKEVVEWIRRGRKAEDFPRKQAEDSTSCSVIVIERDGSILNYDVTPFPIRIEDKIFAVGSGRDFALAAMFLGKTASEAVLVASAFDTGCGNGVDELTLEPLQ